MTKKRCKKDKFRKSLLDKYSCKKCNQTDNDAKKLCKPMTEKQ